jgi:ectonucleotide pyrophosphatase/phosphodiesterase family protein 5
VVAISRRSFLRGTAAGGVALAWTAGGVWARPASAGEEPVRVYQVVVDGLRVDEVERMPTLSRLAAEGTYWPQARAHMVAETTTNHLSMLTGMYPDRHGMPGNSVPRLAPRVSDDRRYTKADSILTIARRQAPELVTATVGSKTYVAELAKHDRTGDGEQDASRTNTPVTALPVIDAAPDAETGTEALLISRELDPDLLFLNLGEVDRVGHGDETGGLTEGGLPVLRQVSLQNADLQLRNLVTELERSGRWERTVFMVTADHSMDWSRRDRGLNLAPVFEADPLLTGEVLAAVNGGACLYALRCPDDPRAPERLRRMRELALGVEGVEEALYLAPNPADGGEAHWVGRVHPTWRLGELGGDLLVTVAAGWRIGHSTSQPAVVANPIPGNHGHPVTLPIPLVIAGGYPGIVTQVIDGPADLADADEHPSQARNIDLAPTAAWLLGLQPPPGGFDGRVLDEAFRARPAPRVPVRNVASVPQVTRIVGDEPLAAAAELSRRTAPAGADEVVMVAADDPVLAAVAAPLAVVRRGPLLLTAPDRLADVTGDELERLAPERVALVGAALGEELAAAVTARTGAEVVRLAGDDAATTAAAVAEVVGVDGDDRRVLLLAGTPSPLLPASVVLAGANHPAAPGSAGRADASGGLFGTRPVLLANAEGLPPATRSALEDLGVRRVTVASGTDELPTAMLASLRGSVELVERVGGDAAAGGAWAAAVRAVDRAMVEGALDDDLYLTASDALGVAAGVLAAVHGGIAVPVAAGGGLPAPVRGLLERRADEFVRILVAAGPGAVPDAAVAAVDRVVRRRRTRPADAGPSRPRGADRRSRSGDVGGEDRPHGGGGGGAGGPTVPPAGEGPAAPAPTTPAPTTPAATPAGAGRALPATGGSVASALGAAAVLGTLALRRRRPERDDTC